MIQYHQNYLKLPWKTSSNFRQLDSQEDKDINGRRLNNLRFADDIVFVAENPDLLQTLQRFIEEDLLELFCQVKKLRNQKIPVHIRSQDLISVPCLPWYTKNKGLTKQSTIQSAMERQMLGISSYYKKNGRIRSIPKVKDI